MTLFECVLLGIIEGLTEFLPISSTGHLILAGKIMGLGSSEFIKSFEIVIQGGAILAVVFLYGGKLISEPAVAARLVVAFLPTGVLGLALYKVIKKSLLGNEQVVLWSLLAGGFLLILFEKLHREKPDACSELSTIPYRKVFLIGVFQSLAMVPGISRAGATILGGLLLGLRRKTIVEFSFLLAIPTMLAAIGADIFFQNFFLFSVREGQLLGIGFVSSFVVAILSIRFLLSYIRTHDFIAFGVYRILAALIFWVVIL